MFEFKSSKRTNLTKSYMLSLHIKPGEAHTALAKLGMQPKFAIGYCLPNADFANFAREIKAALPPS